MVLRQHVGTQSRSKEYFRMGFCVRAIGLAMAGMTVMTGMTWAQEQEDKAVLLVRMFYEAEQWSAKPLRILPCEAPSKPAPHTDRRSVLVLRGDDGKVLARRLITNPRIILIEDPKEQAKLLSQMEFTIAVPYHRGATVFEFFESERDSRDTEHAGEKRPSVATSDLRELARTFEEGGYRERAPCQIIKPRPGNPDLLVKPTDTAISVETVVKLIQRDQGTIIKLGLERELDPDEMRKLIYAYRDNWSQVGIDEKRLDDFLKRYAEALRDSRRK